MTYFSPPFLLALCVIHITTCILNISGLYFTKSILINETKYELLGSKLSIEDVSIDYFAKIPYAKPPINELRFKYPQDFDGPPWTGVYNATIQPNTCWQAEGSEFDKTNSAAKLWLSKTNMSEDCLYLTIWAPTAVTAEKLSVMIWIYGGSFFSGSSTLEVYDGSFLAAKYNVIVVSMQYRLGPLGFLYLDDIEAPGNQGLMDQMMAIKWVKKNIHNFNGDSESITIFGESAGSVSVSLHVLSPVSQNLFKRAIMESAASLASWSIETKANSKDKSVMLAQYVNCYFPSNRTDLLMKCLLGASPEKLVTSQFDLKNYLAKQRLNLLAKRGITDIYTDGSHFFDIFFKPIYDNFFIPKSIDELIVDKNSKNKTELLMGYNANEGMFFLIYGLNQWLKFLNGSQVEDTQLFSSDNPNHLKVSNFVLENIVSNDVAFKNVLPLLLYEYKIPSPILNWKKWNSTQVLFALDQLTGDQVFICPVIDFAETMSEARNKIYLYSFQHRTDASTFPKWTGAMHGYEIEYVFGMPFSKTFQNLFYSFSPDEKRLSELVMTMWTNFAKFGNPTKEKINYLDKNVFWPSFNTTDKLTFYFATPQDSSLEPVRMNEKSTKCKFWSKVLPTILSNRMSRSSSWKTQQIWISLITMLQMIWIAGNLL